MKNIGLFGFGCVGRGLYDLLNIEKSQSFAIKKIVVFDEKKIREQINQDFFFDPNDIFEDSEIDVIVEAINQPEAAFAIVKRSLEMRIPVVTANKKVVAENLTELIRLQNLYNTPVLYEAAVCGSIPVVRKIEDQFGHEPILSIRGIFNGTSNYILSKMFSLGMPYDEALREAQILGLAEKNPDSDVGGNDAKYKAIILAKHALGVSYLADQVFHYGISHLTVNDISFAKDRGLRIKLVPMIKSFADDVSLFVLPQFVNSDDELFRVEDEFNALMIEGENAGVQYYSGKGAGSLPTAFSVFNDVRTAIEGFRYPYRKSSFPNRKCNPDDLFIEVYVRYQNDRVKSSLKFRTVREGYLDDSYKYVIGETTLKNLFESKNLLLDDESTVISTGNIFPKEVENSHLNSRSLFSNEKTFNALMT